jgi:hypothetical protein
LIFLVIGCIVIIAIFGSIVLLFSSVRLAPNALPVIKNIRPPNEASNKCAETIALSSKAEFPTLQYAEY